MELWSKQTEIDFFTQARGFATPEQLFYKDNQDHYYAYWPKIYKGPKTTLQSRNALIGNFTEKWTTDLIQETITEKGLYAIQGAVCPEIALTKQSPADVVISKVNSVNQKPEDILLIIEVKMSVVWNWEYSPSTDQITTIGDYKTHQGNPGSCVLILCSKQLEKV